MQSRHEVACGQDQLVNSCFGANDILVVELWVEVLPVTAIDYVHHELMPLPNIEELPVQELFAESAHTAIKTAARGGENKCAN